MQHVAWNYQVLYTKALMRLHANQGSEGEGDWTAGSSQNQNCKT